DEIVRQVLRNGNARPVGPVNLNVYYPPTSSNVPVPTGSVNNGPNDAQHPDPGHPPGTDNNGPFSTFISGNLSGQVFFKAPPLKLPLQNSGNRPIELIRKGIPGEDVTTSILAQSRFFNKAGIRISLTDTQADLPIDTTSGTNGGVQLDQLNATDGRRGYQPA